MLFEVTDELIINNVKFIYNLLIIFGIARFLYYPRRGKSEYLLSYTLMGTVIFMLCLLIKNIELGLGFAIGIFAIFGIIRFRTVPISTREMTYLFVVIGIGATNGLIPLEVNYLSIVLSHTYIILLLTLIERYFNKQERTQKKEVIYTNLNLLHPKHHEALKKDLQEKYGFEQISRIKIDKIDESKQAAKIEVTLNPSQD